MTTHPYLAFRGNCEKALNFYANLFNATIVNKQTYKTTNRDIPESYRHNLQHAELKGKGVQIMAYDAAPDTPLNIGNTIQMSIELKDKQKAKAIFKALAHQGRTHHQFKLREWNAFYGRCTDKFNIQWMVNCPLD